MHIVKRPKLGSTIRSTVQFHLQRRRMKKLSERSSSQDLAKTRDQFNEKNVVFTVTTGRSGTDSLSAICAKIASCKSLHEPEPNYRYLLQSVQSDPNLAQGFFENIKAPVIASFQEPSYFESSHLFCKGFFEAAVASGFKFGLISLRRESRKIALSLLNKNATPLRTSAGYRFTIGPTSSSYRPIERFDDLSDYQLCYWYCKEIEARQDLYLKVAQELGMKTFDLETPDLNKAEIVRNLLSGMGIGSQQEIDAQISSDWAGVRRNALPGKKEMQIVEDIDAQERIVDERLLAPSSIDDVFERIEKLKRPL